MTFARHASEDWPPRRSDADLCLAENPMDPSLRWGDGLWGPS
jgi:hypothetical protein